MKVLRFFCDGTKLLFTQSCKGMEAQRYSPIHLFTIDDFTCSSLSALAQKKNRQTVLRYTIRLPVW
jgi:hypothetical protein